MGLRLDDVVALLKGRRKREKYLAQALRPYEQATAAPGELRNVRTYADCPHCGIGLPPRMMAEHRCDPHTKRLFRARG